MSNEMRLTDVNALIVKMCRACNNECCEEPCEPGECFMYDAINNAPTVDAKPVVHGRWVWDVESHGDPMYGIDEDYGYRCSECKVWADEYGVDGDIYEEPPTHILHYCPNCGAKMDGDVNA